MSDRGGNPIPQRVRLWVVGQPEMVHLMSATGGTAPKKSCIFKKCPENLLVYTEVTLSDCIVWRKFILSRNVTDRTGLICLLKVPKCSRHCCEATRSQVS